MHLGYRQKRILLMSRIILVAPKSISRHNRKPEDQYRFDYSFWNFFLPLQTLGHETIFFDTSVFGNEALRKTIKTFDPDMLFCVMTGSNYYCPDEPWEAIEELRGSKIKTFNWFCDDSWRFDDFSKNVCKYFDWVSTTEKKYLDNYADIGYSNVVYAPWHSHHDVYSTPSQIWHNVAFAGALRGDRKEHIDHLEANGIAVAKTPDTSFEGMVGMYNSSKIGLNFSKNSTGIGTQAKARVFEVVAAQAVLVTEYNDDLENNFSIGEEIIVFANKDRMLREVTALLGDEEKCASIAAAGYTRYLKDHTSVHRLSTLLKEIA